MLQIIQGDNLVELRKLPEDSVHCVVTSPPFWGLRDYGTAKWEGGDPACDHRNARPGAGRADGIVDDRAQRSRDGAGSFGGDCGKCGAIRIDQQIGLEETPELWCAKLVEVFREVRRVLHPSGTLWLECGDAYARDAAKGQHKPGDSGKLKQKDLLGLPWALAFALRADGWYLRSDIIWFRPNPMPESVTDRCTKSHSYIFLLTKQPRYFYDIEAIKEPVTGEAHARKANGANSRMVLERMVGREDSKPRPSRSNIPGVNPKAASVGLNSGPGSSTRPKQNASFAENCSDLVSSRNKRSVWTIATEAYPGNHYATFPTEIPKLSILAGTSARGVCPRCLEPWVRVVDNGEPDLEHQRACGGDVNGEYFGQATKDYASAKAQNASETKARILRGMVEKKTVAWMPMCDCNAGDPIPATVLDPFMGSGTTAAVALELGRSAVGIELSEDYVKLARQRCAAITPGLTLA